MRLRNRFIRFMYGRNGVDQLGQAESFVLLALVILGLFFGRVPVVRSILYIVVLAGFIHMYFRMFSKNIAKRQKENQWFCNWRYQFAIRRNKRRVRREQRKIYSYFKCPMCKQKVRVPKGRGKVCITCPKCRQEFVRKA